MPSPLFNQASKKLRTLARQQFSRTTFGRLLQDVEWAAAAPGRAPERIRGIVQRYGNPSPQRMMRELMGTDFGSLVGELHRYAKGDPLSGVIHEFLSSLGPSGKLIKALISGGSAKAGIERELQSAMALIRSFGGEVMPKPGGDWGTTEDAVRGIEAARQRLEGLGYTVMAPGERRPARMPETQRRGKQYEVPMSEGRGRRFPADHPIVTGEMVEAQSSNVHSFGYDQRDASLFVRFLGGSRMERGGPGSLYRYANVTPEEFLSLYATRGGGAGDWVWDHLRVRGTVSGHRKDYELVGITGNYVPRKATVMPVPGGGVEEWFIRRQVKTHTGKWRKSALQDEVAVPFGKIGPAALVGARGPRGPRGPGRG